jgi:hypothetical protein
MRRAAARLLAYGLALALAAAGAGAGTAARAPTFAAAGRDATSALLQVWYAGNGLWHVCNAPDCSSGNGDWGDDSMTYTLALRYEATHDSSLLAPLEALIQTAPLYPGPCTSVDGCSSWSDVPAWDAIAAMDIYEATGDSQALTKAETAFAYDEQSSAYALGACPRIRYQQPGGRDNHLKTLETDANAIKAALLLYRATKQPGYLTAARARYDAVRTYFLDPRLPLYSVYVFDDGTTCTQVPHRFFASVNGDMIWSGLELSRDTGVGAYRTQAVATAKAVASDLSDPRGVFADLQAENDIVEPLVEGMKALADDGQSFARTWILDNAAAAFAARGTDGSFGRFFDGPPPATTVTEWQTNGGLALEIAAAALAPRQTVTAATWRPAVQRATDVSTLPATITFRGSGVALLGTLGEQCCEPGHARVLVDGRETVDHTGIWQNKSSSGRSIAGTVLFAWRWPTPGKHTLTFLPGLPNGKEGGPYLHLTGYEVIR